MHVVLLESDYDLRSYAFASETPSCLQPVLGTPLLARTVRWLRGHGVRSIHLVTDRDAAADYALAQAIVHLDLHPAPTLSHVLDKIRRQGALDQPLLLLNANVHPLPDLAELFRAAREGRHALTWIRGSSSHGPGRYTSGPPVVALAAPVVSRMMLFDEHPRPLARMVSLCRRKRLPAGAMDPTHPVSAIDSAYALYHANLGLLTAQYLVAGGANEMRVRRIGERLWVAPEVRVGRAHIDPTGGPVVLGVGAEVGDGAMLRGPILLGEAVGVGAGSCLHRALVLDHTFIPEVSWVANSVVSPRLTEVVAA